MTLEFLPAAQRELTEASEYYETNNAVEAIPIHPPRHSDMFGLGLPNR